MGLSGGGGGGTTVTKTEPWDEQKKFLQTGFQATSALSEPWFVRDKDGNITGMNTVNNALAPAYYKGNTVAPQSAWTTQALTMQANAAKNMAKDPTMKAATAAAQQVASGQALKNNAGLNYLNGITGQKINQGNAALAQLNQLATNDNPYMDALYQRANNQAQASLDSNFNRAGRYGSGSHEAAAADAANNLANQMYGSLYNQRINAAQAASNSYLQGMQEGIGAANNAGSLYNQGQGQRVVAAGTGQQLAQQPYTDAAMLSEAGGVKDDYNQQLINAAIDRYNYEVQRPLQMLSTYNQLISGNYGGTSTAQGQQASGSKLGGALGGGLTGASIGTQIMPGWGTAIGGVGGALLGLFSS